MFQLESLLPYSFPFGAVIVSNIVAQLIKFFLFLQKNKVVNWAQLKTSGGFPSAHSATFAALTTSFFLMYGSSSPLFALTFFITGMVGYDAMNVRYFAGKNAQHIKSLITQLSQKGIIDNQNHKLPKMPEELGHKPYEVMGGIVLGIIITFLLQFIFLYFR